MTTATSDIYTLSLHDALPILVYLQHASDPIAWWTPDLLFSKPDWLREPRGYDVLPQTLWIPVVTFLQVSADMAVAVRSEEHTSELQSRRDLVCRLLLEKKNNI